MSVDYLQSLLTRLIFICSSIVFFHINSEMEDLKIPLRVIVLRTCLSVLLIEIFLYRVKKENAVLFLKK
jgi:Na+-driven multidrug efflux pump